VLNSKLLIGLPLFIEDIDECANLNGGCSGTCVNTEGSYYCGCTVGWQLAQNGRLCIGRILILISGFSIVNLSCRVLFVL